MSYHPRYHSRRPCNREGATLVLLSVLIVALMVLCGAAINIAYMQLNRTELRVATDAAARAAGRAFSEYQDVDEAIFHATSTAALNDIFGQPLIVNADENAGEIVFGLASRLDSADGTVGAGRFGFSERTTSGVREKTEIATAVRVFGKRTLDSAGGPHSDAIQWCFTIPQLPTGGVLHFDASRPGYRAGDRSLRIHALLPRRGRAHGHVVCTSEYP